MNMEDNGNRKDVIEAAIEQLKPKPKKKELKKVKAKTKELKFSKEVKTKIDGESGKKVL